MSTEQRRRFGGRLADLRRAVRLSQRQMAERLSQLSGVQSVTRNEVSRWKRGERVPDSWLPCIARALGVPLEDLEREAAYTRAQFTAVNTGEELTLRTRNTADVRLLQSPDADRAAMDSFRMADRQLGGGHLYLAVTHYLNREVAPRLFGTGSARSVADTFSAAAALTEMAGWMAHDSGHDARALRHLEHALPLARAGVDQALTGHVLASMSHLALHTDRSSDAIALARAGHEAVKESPFPPTLRARLHAMEARALARQGEVTQSLEALDASAACLAQRGGVASSAWISEFDAASLASESALCLRDLGKLASAAEEAERAVSLRAGDRARSRVFGQITLAAIRAELGELDAACAAGGALLESCRALGSIRITQQLSDLATVLRPHQAEAMVAEFLESLAGLNRERSLLLAGIVASDGEGGTGHDQPSAAGHG